MQCVALEVVNSTLSLSKSRLVDLRDLAALTAVGAEFKLLDNASLAAAKRMERTRKALG
ncbi:MAG: hypothetical protein QM756_38635 [Polyangiaceae bacterium]